MYLCKKKSIDKNSSFYNYESWTLTFYLCEREREERDFFPLHNSFIVYWHFPASEELKVIPLSLCNKLLIFFYIVKKCIKSITNIWIISILSFFFFVIFLHSLFLFLLFIFLLVLLSYIHIILFRKWRTYHKYSIEGI